MCQTRSLTQGGIFGHEVPAGVQGYGVVDCVGLSSGFQVLGVEL